MHFMIHSCNRRLWYVKKYLIPSLVKQGIDKKNIIIWNDDENRGNLQSWIKSCEYVRDNLPENRGTWHLQDDVILARSFSDQVKYIVNNGVICGFVSEKYNKRNKDYIGKTKLDRMWCSMPCMYIPNKYMGEFVEWIERVKNRAEYRDKYASNRHDDFFFIHFLKECYPKVYSFHIKPNIVDHVDYLVGGSVNKERVEKVMAYYFEDKDLVEELKGKLEKRR